MSDPANSEQPSDSKRQGDKERRRIAGRAGIVALGTLFSRLLGLVRDITLAAVFTRAATDAWMIAFQIPNLLRQLLAEGAVQTAVLPVLTDIREKQGEAEARRFFAALRGLSLVVLLVVAVLGVLFAPQLVDVFASGFRERPGQFELTVELTRWVFPYIFFMGTAALGVAVLNTYKRFVVTSFAPALLNVAFVIFALSLPTWLGAQGYPRIAAMAFGALVGGVLQVAAQWPSLRAIGYLSVPTFAWNHPGVREVLRRLAPTLLGIGVYYIDVIVGRRLLSDLGEGAVTYFSYALRLCDFTQGIFVMALSAATLPSLSGFVSRGEMDEVGRTFAYAMRHALFVGIASTALFVTLAEPIVSLLLQRGEFGATGVRETSYALMAQGVSIFLVAGVRQLVIVYFALGDTKTPVKVAAVDLVVFAGGSLLLREHFGHIGVSLGVSLARICQFTLLWRGLGKRLPSTHGTEIVRSSGKTLLGSVLAAASAWAIVSLIGIDSSAVAWLRPVPALAGAMTFGLVFLGASALLKSAELDTIVRPVLARLRG